MLGMFEGVSGAGGGGGGVIGGVATSARKFWNEREQQLCNDLFNWKVTTVWN